MSDWFDIREAEHGTFIIEEPFHVEKVKSYLIVGSDRAILLDTGMGIADIRTEVETLTDKPIVVVNSHAHWDHVGGNHLFGEILIHPAEADDLAEGFPNARMRRWFLPDQLTGPLPEGVTADTVSFPGSTATGLVVEGQILDLGDRVLEVMHCPGHSPGGIVLVDRANGVLFSTDVAYGGALYVYATEDLAIYQRSLARLAALAPDLRICYPCHNESPMSPELLPRMADGLAEIVSGLDPSWVDGNRTSWNFDGFAVELKLQHSE
ncbi:MAG: MBL fold metallo-hydrolase [Thermomicrobiales bacterium]